MVFFAPSSSDRPPRFPEKVFAETVFDSCVVFHTVQRAANLAASGVSHTAKQTVTPRYFVFIRIQQVDGLQTNLRRIDTEFFERNFFVTPPGNRLLDLALAPDWRVLLQPQHRGDGNHSGARDSALQHRAPR
jgi:hypothetical protein